MDRIVIPLVLHGTVKLTAWCADANEALREFLLARNPKQQHSATLESYMIKPIQRILKYPLLLQQLCAHTLAGTDEHHHLTGRACWGGVFCLFELAPF